MWQVECAKSSYSFYLQTPRAQTFSISERWHLCWQFSVQIRVYLDFVLRGRFTSEWCDVLRTVGWRELRCCRGTLSVSLRSHCNWKNLLFFLIPPFLLSAFNSSFMGAEESSYHRAAPRAKNEIGRGGGEREAGSGRWGVRVFVWHRERETDGERGREEAVCSFHLLISFPGGSIIGWTIAGN